MIAEQRNSPMKKYPFNSRALLLLLALCLGLAACSESQQPPIDNDPEPFASGDECHVCGMIIMDFPGPKGLAMEKNAVKKFCSTAELFGWWLQPENQILKATLYVHDMTDALWGSPDDRRLIDATTAYYVVGAALKGSMGATLASFADKDKAQQFATAHGGRVLRFDDIDLELLQQEAKKQYNEALPHGDHHSGH